MLSYTGRRTRFGQLANNTQTGTLTIADALMNDATRMLLGLAEWDFLEKTKTTTSTASTQFYDLPSDCGKLISVTYTNGNIYTPMECTSRDHWNALNMTSQTSDTPEWFYIFNGQVGFYPTPSSSSKTITFIYQRSFKDLSIADYTTGTITTATTGSSSIVGSGSSWTDKMEGRYLKITDSDTANTGDGFWYEIEDVDTGTTMTLTRLYAGPSIAAGSAAYTIGQMAPLPEDYQTLPVYKALEIYFSSIQPEPDRAKIYRDMFDNGLADMKRRHGSKSTSPVIDAGYGKEMVNPNNYPSSIG